jgi:PPP family 3-phenylpropionic acid transporter
MGLGVVVPALVAMFLRMFAGFAAIFILIALFNIFLSPVSSLADSATVAMLGRARAMYGRVRLGGTFGWGLFAPVAGLLVQKYGLTIGFWAFSGFMLVNFFISQRFVHGSHEVGAANPGGIRVLLASRRWIRFLFLALLGGIGAFSVSTYLFPYMAGLGANESTMGLALTLATITEIPIFFFGDRLIRRFTSYGLLTLALAMIGIRSLLYAAASTPFMVLLVQVFGGTIFPAMWLAGVAYADENAPLGLKSSAQGLFSAISFGVGSAVGGFVGGPLLETIGGRGMFLVFGVVVLVGLAVAEAIRRLLPDPNDLAPVIAVASDK